MKIKQNVTLEVEKGEYTFVFHLPMGASWGNGIDAAFDVLQKLNELAQNSAQALKPSQAPVKEGE